MKISCERDKLQNAFQTASSVAPSRSPKPILQNVKLEVRGDSAILMATDLEIGVRVELPGVEIEAPGSAVLPISRFSSILRESSDVSLKIETDGQNLVVSGQKSEFRLPAENPDEFPAVASFSENKYHEIPARLFKELIRRTVFATDNESSRYALGGVLLELTDNECIAVGTDGRRLAKMAGPGKSVGGHATAENATTIVPTKAMNLIDRALTEADAEIHIAARANDILVKSPRVTIYSRLVEGRYPRWRDVFPQRGGKQIELLVGPFHAAVRQAAIVTSDESRGVDFTFGGGSVVMSGRSANVGQSRVELPVQYEGEDVAITLDPRFLSDFLKVLDPGKKFTLELKDSESAAVCSTDDGYGYVIMPLARDR